MVYAYRCCWNRDWYHVQRVGDTFARSPEWLGAITRLSSHILRVRSYRSCQVRARLCSQQSCRSREETASTSQCRRGASAAWQWSSSTIDGQEGTEALLDVHVARHQSREPTHRLEALYAVRCRQFCFRAGTIVRLPTINNHITQSDFELGHGW